MASNLLSARDHSRESAGLRYVYPVVSRRAGGLSLGINLNPNNACNWRCLYCQVPNLRRGAAPATDLARLEAELRGFLEEATFSRFLADRVPTGMRRIHDIALSGNGEPTSSKAFEGVVELLGKIRCEHAALADAKLVLITNGSLVRQAHVQAGLRAMARLDGDVWFKLDSATKEGMRAINGTTLSPARVRDHLERAAHLCATWIQTCVFAVDGLPPVREERAAYLALIRELVGARVPLRGVLLYGVARPSMQPEAPRLAPVSDEWMAQWASEIAGCGLEVKWRP
ncbi:MAG: radical SAM protein [Betaproteobacteria bacterium]|nr:radical SAM protein [Betaproteobacteria bacterium]